MLPTQPSPDPGYAGLQERILQRLLAARVPDQIFTKVATAYDAALAGETLVLSRAERKRLLAQVTRRILEEMLAQLGPASGAET